MNVLDENEYEPYLQISTPSLTLNETFIDSTTDTSSLLDYHLIPSFSIDCSDRDINSSLTIELAKVGYVNQYDTHRFIDERLWSDHLSPPLTDLFRLTVSEDHYDDEDHTGDQIRSHKAALLSFNQSRLDFESLYNVNENLIRLDFVCSDGTYQTTARLLVRVEDLNDNSPKFETKSVTLGRKETSEVDLVYTAVASDSDASPRYGNASLRYSIEQCWPENFYRIRIDQFSGAVYSNLRLELEPNEIAKIKQNIDSSESDRKATTIMKYPDFNRVECQIGVKDSSSGGALSDTMNLTIEIENINNSPPVILQEVDKNNEIVIEVSEGERTSGLVLAKIPVLDADGAENLKCLFAPDGYYRQDLFEVSTSCKL